MILSAIERRWRRSPDLRLGQMLANLVGDRPLGLVEDGELLTLVGPESDAERAYTENEPAARKAAWRDSIDSDQGPG